MDIDYRIHLTFYQMTSEIYVNFVKNTKSQFYFRLRVYTCRIVWHTFKLFGIYARVIRTSYKLNFSFGNYFVYICAYFHSNLSQITQIYTDGILAPPVDSICAAADEQPLSLSAV